MRVDTLLTSPSPCITGFFALAFGCCAGSFLNVCIWRLPRGQSLTAPRFSLCPGCGNTIKAYDNIPLVSFALLRGRCRHCAAAISWRYPLIEALTGLLFLALYWRQGRAGRMSPGEMIVMALLFCLLIAASGIDMEFLIIPDELTLYGLLGGLTAGLVLPHLHGGSEAWHTFADASPLNGLLAAIIGAACGGGIILFFAIAGGVLFRREAIGFGDVKLMAMIGSFTGWRIALAAFALAPFFALLYGVPLLVVKKQHALPFGPFLSAAAVTTLLLRDEIAAFIMRYTVG